MTSHKSSWRFNRACACCGSLGSGADGIDRRAVLKGVLAAAAASLPPVGHALAQGAQSGSGGRLKVFTAGKVVTMNASAPTGTAVATRGGRIVAVGSMDDLQPWLDANPYDIDDTFKDKVLLPGFIDPHMHPIIGGLVLTAEFITPFPWDLPTGNVPQVRGREAFLDRLRQLEKAQANQTEPLLVWGYNPTFHGVIARPDLDQVSATRPIGIWHQSLHEIWFNTAAIDAIGFTASEVAGNSQINLADGHFWEAGMFAVAAPKIAPFLLKPARVALGLNRLRDVIKAGGITTIGDMAFGTIELEMEWAAMSRAYEHPTTPFRVQLTPDVGKLALQHGGDAPALEFVRSLPKRNLSRMAFGNGIKLFADGAFLSQAMQMGSPGYIDGHHGEWITPPDELAKRARLYWDAGYQIHVHANGDAGIGMVLDTLEKLQAERPRVDHRFTLEHYGYSTVEQARRCAALGALVSANPYYLWSLGETYARIGLGADRARQISRLGTVARQGIPVALHSDFSIAPMQPLLLAWMAANRVTEGGGVMGPEERLTLDRALRGITTNAAYALGMEQEVGSIEPGKKADFTVLADNPYELDPMKLKDIPIAGTVFEGVAHPTTGETVGQQR